MFNTAKMPKFRRKTLVLTIALSIIIGVYILYYNVVYPPCAKAIPAVEPIAPVIVGSDTETPQETPPERTVKYTKDQFADYIQKTNPKVFSDLAAIIADGIFRASQEFDIDPLYLLALAEIESTFNYTAVSNADCVGLLQINPEVWLKEGNAQGLQGAGIATTTKDLYDPYVNSRAGAFIVKHYMQQGETKEPHSSPLEFALTRYLGGTVNAHYEKFLRAVGKFTVYSNQMEAL